MKYIVLDLEATCWEEKGNGPNEIIEIGALCFNERKEKLGEFVTFIKPSVNPKLSPFCTQLTSITQEQVDGAPFFPEAIGKFQDWILSFEDDYVLCSWGFYDKKQFKEDCQLHGIATDWIKSHISLKHQHAKINDIRATGMSGALWRDGFELDGTHHRGIDDARNIAKIFLKYFEQWEV